MRWYYAIIANLDVFPLLLRYFLHSNTKNMTLTSFSFRVDIVTLIKDKKNSTKNRYVFIHSP